jgi:hypothetical protein
VTSRIRKHVRIEPEVLAELEVLVAKKTETSLSNEVNTALKEHIRRHKAGQEDIILAPILDRLLQESVNQTEGWLRPGVWAGATYSATASLLLLELLCGQTVDPSEAKTHLELIRGRAWKMVRRSADQEGGV